MREIALANALVDNKVARDRRDLERTAAGHPGQGPTTLSGWPTTCPKTSASRTSRRRRTSIPADRAATAALQQIPMMDTVVRKLIEFGERSIRQQLLAGAVRLGDDQMPDIWASHRAALARLDIDADPGSVHVADAVHERDGDRLQEADRGAQLGHGEPDGRARAAHRARARGRATSCPTTRSTGRRSCILLRIGTRPLMAAAVLRRPAAAGDPARAAGVVPRRGADLRPRGDARQPQPDDDLPDDDGDGGRRGLAQAQPRRVRQAGQRVRRVGAGLGQADALRPRARRSRTRTRCAACTS